MSYARLYPPPAVLKIVSVLEHGGYEAWCVGGAVRDSLLGISHLDWDIATSARPQQVRKLFRRTVPVGIEFGTVGVLDDTGVMHEVTTFRRDVRTDGRHAEVEFGASLDEDLSRRDFTINAIAYAPSTDEIRDPFGGRADLSEKLVRAVGVASERMREDRLRALRAIRFAARFGFAIESETWQAIVESEPYLDRLSPERIKQEMEKTMEQVAVPSGAFKLWRAAGIFRAVIPTLDSANDITLHAIDYLCQPGVPGRPQRLLNRVTTLFSGVPSEGVSEALKGLRFSNAENAWISSIIERWQRLDIPISEALLSGEPADPVVRRWVAIAGRTRFASLMRVGSAIWEARRRNGDPAPSGARIRALYKQAIRIAYRDPVELADLAIDGNNVRTVGATGPAIGRVLQRLLIAVLEDPSRNTFEGLLEMARRFAAEDAPSAGL